MNSLAIISWKMRMPRGARKKGRRDREPAAEAEPVRVIHSLDLDAATVALPAGVDLESRAETDE